MKTKPKLLLNDTKPGIDEGHQSWYPEPFYSFVKNDDSSGLSSDIRGTFRSSQCKLVSCKFINADGICSSCVNIPNLPSFRNLSCVRN